MLGLYWSRTAKLEEAQQCLEALAKEFPEDEETIGILGGVYKRLWQKSPDRQDHLASCHQTYQRGWKSSRKRNTYLGINTATTALWLKKHDVVKQTAEKVREVLQRRINSLARQGGDRSSVLSFWDQVTLAEVELLLRHDEKAKSLYQHAFTQFPDLKDNIEVSQQQAQAILKARG